MVNNTIDPATDAFLKRADTNNETFNFVSHIFGFALSVAGLVVLIVLSAREPYPALRIVSFSIYGATLCALYLCSSVYHLLCRLRLRGALAFQRVDHSAIYLLIAGSYTPLCLLVIRGGWGWSLLGVSWGLAFVGIALKIFLKNADDVFSYSLYGIMGWLALVAIVPICRTFSIAQILLLVSGGIAYTAGAILLAFKKPAIRPGVFSYHELWHIFVMLGSIMHFFLMLLIVV